jgi:outer membrane protein
MSDQEKQAYYQQLQQRLASKQQELISPILDKVEATIKSVADAKGLSVVLDKNNVVYGGQDITEEVTKKIAK